MSSSDPVGHDAKKTRLENISLRVGIVSTSVGLLIAVATFLGLKLHTTADARDVAQGSVQTLEVVVSTQGAVLAENSDELESVNRALTSSDSVIQSLSGRLASLSGSPTTELSAVGTHKLTRRGSLTLNLGYCANLDSTRLDWQVVDQCGTNGAIGGDADVRYSYQAEGLYFLNGADVATFEPVSGSDNDQSNLSACESTSNYTVAVSSKQIVPGLHLCVRTASASDPNGAHQAKAVLVVESTDASPSDPYSFTKVTFSVSVYSP